MRAPAENPRTWSPEAQRFFGAEFTRLVDEGTAIFSPFTLKNISDDPSLAIALERQAYPLHEKAIQLGSKVFLDYVFKYNRAKREPATAIGKLDDLIASAYPEWLGGTYSENIFLNTIMRGIRSHVLARLAKWRHQNNKTNRLEKPLYDLLGIYDGAGGSNRLEGYLAYFEFLRLEKFFEITQISRKDDEKGVSALEREGINDTLARIISENRQFGIPLSISKNDQLGKQSIDIQSEDIDVHSPEYAEFFARIILYSEQDSKLLREKPILIENTKAKTDNNLFRSFHGIIGDSVPLFVSRDGGHIHGLAAHPQGLKFFLGSDNYELLRTHLLLKLAELTCRGDKLRQALKGVIELPPELSGVPKNAGSTPHPRLEKLLPVRYFPRSALAENHDSDSDAPSKTLRLHNVEYHVRLLPVGHQPSRKALELARDHDMTLGNVETETGIRYETFVRKHERGLADPILTAQNPTLAIQAKSRHDLVDILESNNK